MKAPFSSAIAIAVGLVVLLGYFLPIPALQSLRVVLFDWAIILAAIATWVGVANLLSVHLGKAQAGKSNAFYSVVVIVGFGATLLAGLFLGPNNDQFQRVVTDIQVPVEASLVAVLTVSLALASIRLLRRRANLLSVLFLAAAVVFLILDSGFLPLEQISILVSALTRLPIAGARGIILGIALGSLATGLRILMGSDRPYSG